MIAMIPMGIKFQIMNVRNKLDNLPLSPGIYIFKDKAGNILYIGKATSLKDRVRSYFSAARDSRIAAMVKQINDIQYRQTDSVLEALILESHLIKRYQPKYNVKDKDDKSFVYAVITKEEFPRVLVTRKTDLDQIQNAKLKNQNYNSKLKTDLSERLKIKESFGPYTSKRQLEIALKIIRRIFPYHVSSRKTEKECFDFQLGKCPGPYAGAITREDYLKNIRGIRMILEGKKRSLITRMEKEMKEHAKVGEFEKAATERDKVFALRHIHDVALLIREELPEFESAERIMLRVEAYDSSNISGQYATGSMVVFCGSEPQKSEYRKFKIKTVEGADDVGMMREVLIRRFRNSWKMPGLILLDGGEGHLNMAARVLRDLHLDIPLAAVAKGPERKKQEVRVKKKEVSSKNKAKVERVLNDKELLKYIMDEAHRFAIGYHRKLRGKGTIK